MPAMGVMDPEIPGSVHDNLQNAAFPNSADRIVAVLAANQTCHQHITQGPVLDRYQLPARVDARRLQQELPELQDRERIMVRLGRIWSG